MFGIGLPELLLILVVALVVLGPKRLPELARSLGRALAELKKTAEDLKENLNVDEEWREVKKKLEEPFSFPEEKSDKEAKGTEPSPLLEGAEKEEDRR
jgi:Tat protein translocase TatB subunit